MRTIVGYSACLCPSAIECPLAGATVCRAALCFWPGTAGLGFQTRPIVGHYAAAMALCDALMVMGV